MRKFFYGLGIFTALLITASGLGFYVLARDGAALDRVSKAYVEDSIVAVAANWNVDELWKRTIPHFRQTTNVDDVRGLFDAARSALGPLVEYRGSEGEAAISVHPSNTIVSAKYVAKAHFEKGDALVQLTLLKQGDAWMIEGFHIRSSALMRKLVGVRS